jgi:hypothetical protein
MQRGSKPSGDRSRKSLLQIPRHQVLLECLGRQGLTRRLHDHFFSSGVKLLTSVGSLALDPSGHFPKTLPTASGCYCTLGFGGERADRSVQGRGQCGVPGDQLDPPELKAFSPTFEGQLQPFGGNRNDEVTSLNRHRTFESFVQLSCHIGRSL